MNQLVAYVRHLYLSLVVIGFVCVASTTLPAQNSPEYDFNKLEELLNSDNKNITINREDSKRILMHYNDIKRVISTQQTILDSQLLQISEQEKQIAELSESINKEGEEIEEINKILFEQEEKLKTLIRQSDEQRIQLDAKIIALHEHEIRLLQQNKEMTEQKRELAIQKGIVKQQYQSINAKYKHIRQQAVFLSRQLQEIHTHKEIIKNRSKEIQEQKRLVFLFVAFLGLFLVFAALVFRRMRQKIKAGQLLTEQKEEIEQRNTLLNEQYNQIQEQKNSIEQKNNLIHHSLVYAKQIQQSILTPIQELRGVFPESFVLFRPKDMVSGDFYFFQPRNKGMLIAAVDCTGHGVPGAFMTLIGSKRFQQAVPKAKTAGEILSEVNRTLKEVLKQSSADGSLRDGMDAIVCEIDMENKLLHYAGANRPLWVIKADAPKTILEIKPTRSSIGGKTSAEQDFETHQIEVQPGDLVYLFSDGYSDQFNAFNQKILPYRLKELLLANQHLPMLEQQQHLENFLSNWRGEEEQTDDIMIIGIRI